MCIAKLAAMALICASAALGSVCTPINVPAVIVQGQTFQPAIVNGLDNISYSQVRFQWTSDGAATPVNYQRIVFATDAQWAANGNRIIAGTPGVNYIVQAAGNQYVNANDTIQGNSVSNLQASTKYHMAGQSSPDGGSTFCPVAEVTFTTSAFTGVVKPVAPLTFPLTQPTVTGTDYTLGVSPCTSLQTCLNLAQPGDGIGIPPGSPALITTNLQLPVPASAVAVTPTVSSSSFTLGSGTTTGLGLTNGAQVHFGTFYYIPSPVSPGVTYSIINATATTFQVSLDGTSPLTLNDTGLGTIYVIKWPISQNYVVIHSTAAASALPPAGVRLDPVAYRNSLGVIKLITPAGGDLLEAGQLSSFYWFKNIEFDTAPYAPTTQTDPVPYAQIFHTGPESDHIVFDQCYFHPAPAPDRIKLGAIWGGTNQAIMNSYMDNLNYWKYTRTVGNTTVGATSLTIPSGNYTWPGAGGVKQTCSISSPATINFSSAAGTFPFYVQLSINPCTLTVIAQTGLSVSGSGVSVISSSTPFWTTTTDPAAPGVNIYTGLIIGSGTFTGSAITGYGDYCLPACAPGLYNVAEGAEGILFDNGAGPFLYLNNYSAGSGIVGPFHDFYSGQACPGEVFCAISYNNLDLTVQRSTITWDLAYTSSSPSWNGSWWFGRNGPELKTGGRSRWEGNILGPFFGGVGTAGCLSFLNYYNYNRLNLVNTQFTGDIEISNNTCTHTGDVMTISSSGFGTTPGNPLKRAWIHNNLFQQDNGYQQNPPPTLAAPNGFGTQLTTLESVLYEHNTSYLQGGIYSGSLIEGYTLSGGLNISNNIFSYDADNSIKGFTFSSFGGTTSQPDPETAQGSALLAYLNNTIFTGNVFLGTCSNSTPGSPYCATELTSSQASSAAALYPAAPGSYFPNAGSTLAQRIAGIHWFDPARFNFRLNSQSPYISGARTSSDGLDVGADMDALEAAQGKVTNVRAFGITTSSATVAFLAPDTTGCSVDWGTSNFPSGTGTWTRVANSGGARAQAITLTSLPAATPITYRVNCAVVQPSGSFSTH